ncbi:hypothetical protein LHYA1_G000052 [Lachnellula hyalina]|uniref:Uncharacterized protein n=1 Tax=Lachnellula hyalina TaxID=1316788 RepID=A0A8H8R9N2_9HELO|nr:uncharacterized protein LHYA1_G000052 [Lachnellula hyalina]TVY31112.1 hypothetical protein LHYA1_G000052 [Lachnellula hyalina]
MSTQNPSYGTKVTDPNASSIEESTGAVANDSLAAESTRANGGFASNRGSEPQGVSGSNSTFANTNTSGATRLDPASDAEARQAEGDWAEEKKLGGTGTYPDAAGGQAKGLAVTNTQGSYQTGGASSNAGTAPSYVSSQYVDGGGPKGKNLTEGGFESNDSKNASWSQDIGGKNDPGRLAEQKFERQNAGAGPDAGHPRQKGVSGDNTYDALGGDTQA